MGLPCFSGSAYRVWMNAASLCLHVGFFYREIELLGRDGSLYAASEQLPIYGADNRVHISRLREIIIDFFTDAMNCGFKSGVCRQEDCHGIWIGFPHGLYNCESVAFPVNIDVRQQNIKALSFYRCERLRYICDDLHLKSALLKNRQQRQSNARFIIHQESSLPPSLFVAILFDTPPQSWFSRSSRALLSSSTMERSFFGSCSLAAFRASAFQSFRFELTICCVSVLPSGQDC